MRVLRQICRKASRSGKFGSVFVILTTLTACGTTSAPDYLDLLGEPEATYAKIDSHYGNYLAAHEATRLKDSKAAASYYARTLRSDPDNQALLERAFLFELADGNKAQARKLAAKLIEASPDNRLGRMALAVGEIERGRSSKARDHLELSARGLYNGFAVELITAWTYAATGDFDKVETILTDLNALGREDVFRPFHLALIYDLEEKDELAARNYRLAHEASGGGAIRIVDAWGRFLERQGRRPEAIEVYESFLEYQPGHALVERSVKRARLGEKVPERLIRNTRSGVAEALYGVASLLARDSNVNLPVLYLQIALWANPNLQDARFMMGDIFWQGEQYRRAVAVMAAVPPSHPFAPEASVQIALSFERMGRPEEAEKVLRRAIAAHPESPVAIIALGDVLRANEMYERAISAYDRAFEIVGDENASWFLYYSRGASLELAGFWTEGETDLLAALKLAPDQPIILNHLGYSWIDRGLRLEEGLELVQTAVKFSPGNGFIVDSLGWAYFRLGEYETAIRHLERALELEPEDPTLQEHLGDAYWMTGREREARFQWQHALDRGATPDQAEKINVKLIDGLTSADPVT